MSRRAQEDIGKITITPDVMCGQPCVAGTRLTVRLILENLAGASTVQDLLRDYPSLTEEDVQAAIRYGAEHYRNLDLGFPIRVWLDDEREAPPGWIHVRTAAEAIALFKKDPIIIELSLDHDLGEPAAGTGYDVVAWIEQAVAEGEICAPWAMRVHSRNPVGRQRMEAAIASIRRMSDPTATLPPDRDP